MKVDGTVGGRWWTLVSAVGQDAFEEKLAALTEHYRGQGRGILKMEAVASPETVPWHVWEEFWKCDRPEGAHHFLPTLTRHTAAVLSAPNRPAEG